MNPMGLTPEMNHQVVYDYVRYACYHYTPSKPNKKKMKQLIESIPFFLPEERQDLFYGWIRKYPIESYWDTRESLQTYGYMLYSQAMTKTKIKTQKEYMEDLYCPPNAYQRNHSLVFFLVLFILFYFLSRIK
jgi:hypothetical protein